MTEHVWYSPKLNQLYVTFMDPHLFVTWTIFDPQSCDRAMEQAEPPMPKEMEHTFTYLGEL